MSTLVLVDLEGEALADFKRALRHVKGLVSHAEALDREPWGLVLRFEDEEAFEGWRAGLSEPPSLRVFREQVAARPGRLEAELLDQLNALVVDFREQGRRLSQLQAACPGSELLAELLRLGMLTACAGCHRVRTAEGTWSDLLESLAVRGVQVSHGLCPECAARGEHVD